MPLSLSSTELLCYNLFDDRSSQVKTRSECPLLIKKKYYDEEYFHIYLIQFENIFRESECKEHN
jgi:hypothetical protein